MTIDRDKLRTLAADPYGTHWEGCYLAHPWCAVLALLDETERLRAEVVQLKTYAPPPWLDDLLDSLGHEGGTFHDAIRDVRAQRTEVERLRAVLVGYLCPRCTYGDVDGCVGYPACKALHGEGQEPTDEPMTPGLLHLMLGLAMEHPPSMVELARLTQEQMEEAARWAGAVHLAASDNPVEVPPRPDFLQDGETP